MNFFLCMMLELKYFSCRIVIPGLESQKLFEIVGQETSVLTCSAAFLTQPIFIEQCTTMVSKSEHHGSKLTVGGLLS